jgi:hypothetical protein
MKEGTGHSTGMKRLLLSSAFTDICRTLSRMA